MKRKKRDNAKKDKTVIRQLTRELFNTEFELLRTFSHISLFALRDRPQARLVIIDKAVLCAERVCTMCLLCLITVAHCKAHMFIS